MTSLAMAAEQDSGLWTTAVLAKSINEKFGTSVALQLRFNEDVERLERTLIRPAVSYKVDGRQTTALGYDAHFIDSPNARVEQRLWQQYQFTQKFSTLSAGIRLRLEQRFIDHVDGVPVRLRLRPSIKLSLGESPWVATIANEFFIGFNEVRRGQRGAYHENRAFVGFERSLGRGMLGQIGYQNQTIERRGADIMIHQLFVSFGLSLR